MKNSAKKITIHLFWRGILAEQTQNWQYSASKAKKRVCFSLFILEAASLIHWSSQSIMSFLIFSKNTKLKKIFLMNDFEAVGYGINLLEKKDIKTIKSARKVQKAPIVVIGPGTGIGKATLVFNEEKKLYVPMPSEVGHSDFAAQDKFDMELIDFIKKTKKIKESISYDELVAGHGLSSIYLFLKKVKKFNDSKFSKEIENSDYSPEIISKYRNHDKTCSITFKIYKNYFARLAKNCALDAIPLGGLYFVGNISNINKEIFDKEFVKAFESNYRVKELLKKTPIYLVLNTNIGLLGAGFFCAKGL